MDDEIELTPDRELQQNAKIVTEALHDAEDVLSAAADSLPEGEEKDEYKMKSERLSDEAWRIEEMFDLDPRPSGLWPKTE
jgi:hypothetical protein